jgi:hypothetical protein
VWGRYSIYIVDNSLPERALGSDFTGRTTTLSTQTKSFWVLFTILSIAAVWLPMGWAILETFVALIVSWWVIYHTDLF